MRTHGPSKNSGFKNGRGAEKAAKKSRMPRKVEVASAPVNGSEAAHDGVPDEAFTFSIDEVCILKFVTIMFCVPPPNNNNVVCIRFFLAFISS